MLDWQMVSLGEVTQNFDSIRKPVKTTERIAGPYPYYGASGVIDRVEGYLFDGTYLLIAEDGENLRSRSTPIAFLAHGQFWVNNHAHVVQGNGKADTRFLSHLLAVTDIAGYLTGSTQPKLTRAAMDSIRLCVPPITEQQAIAEVLGALDDKIAANTKLAETADALATSTFNKALLDASFSDRTFADLARVSGGGTPSTKVPEFWDGDVPWATPTDVTALRGPYLEATSRTISEAGLAACASELYPAETILMTSRATIGAFALTQVPTAVNQGFIVVQAYDPDLHFWLFHEMRSRTDEFISLANGATFLELSRGNFKKFKVRLTSPEEMTRFNETAKVLHRTAREALQESRTLAATRDALLPQLMSGKLRVKDIEQTMGEMV
ncbi:restriction endonuclease subunit S [Arthrobacter sp. BL-252-APC-1A]|uniref:restriction endonuclease subunit S n=1 Tax=Arthrobacter sp. BL-252-APC-1A TaxID=2606622 RepID=UPI0012B42CB2|nr:restriction endonuclease subunit S [Arthrobacter sp. BL-252-APC-1A]MSR99269.1 restriction endonuclease subunit S [Arthrobacter sp. BL-252-APC-1A]